MTGSSLEGTELVVRTIAETRNVHAGSTDGEARSAAVIWIPAVIDACAFRLLLTFLTRWLHIQQRDALRYLPRDGEYRVAWWPSSSATLRSDAPRI
jgi:hypothetical protein